MSSPVAPVAAEFPARTAALRDAFAFVRAFCDAHAIAADDALRAKLIVEELFTNSVRHGYGVESDDRIYITLNAMPGEVALLYEDEAPSFDPTSRFFAPCPAHSSDEPMRPVGGVGLRLIGEIVRHARYAREEGRNRLWLVVPRSVQAS